VFPIPKFDSHERHFFVILFYMIIVTYSDPRPLGLLLQQVRARPRLSIGKSQVRVVDGVPRLG
jgi:hypothetical protein